jgi:sulfatase modifying factor 1
MKSENAVVVGHERFYQTSALLALLFTAAIAWHMENSALAAPVTKQNSKDNLVYVHVDPGTFRMGCSPNDVQCSDAEKPPHSVTISKAFWIGQTEVTQEAYKKVIGSNVPNHFRGEKLPVDSASWNDAQVYCEAVGMRLPTEAEYEFAARGGKTELRYGPLVKIAWYDGNSGQKTHEVQKLDSNGYQLYDMLGNVWEWVGDWYGPYHNDDKRPEQDPKGPANGYYRVLRGGSANRTSDVVRVSNRIGNEPGDHGGTDYVGFRCAANDPVIW